METEGYPPKNKFRAVIEMPGLPKGANGSHGNYRAVSAQKRMWRAKFCYAAKAKAPPKPLARVGIICTRYSSGRMDFDGLVISFKQATDALVDAGYILDDRDSVIVQRKYQQLPAKLGQGRITIEIYEIDDDDLKACPTCGK